MLSPPRKRSNINKTQVSLKKLKHTLNHRKHQHLKPTHRCQSNSCKCPLFTGPPLQPSLHYHNELHTDKRVNDVNISWVDNSHYCLRFTDC